MDAPALPREFIGDVYRVRRIGVPFVLVLLSGGRDDDHRRVVSLGDDLEMIDRLSEDVCFAQHGDDDIEDWSRAKMQVALDRKFAYEKAV
ncbi:MAG: hypothetical protein ACRDRW_03830 [Pseudonocardiaceae bacterium]